MKKYSPEGLMRGLALAGVLFAFSVPVQSVQWSVLDQSPPASVAAVSISAFSQAVRKASGGSLVLNPVPAAANLSPAQLMADVADGRIALASLALSAFESSDPVVAMERVPYLATNFVDAAKLWQVLGPYVGELLKARGMTLLYAVPMPPVAPLSRGPLLQMKDWRGHRVVLDAPAIGAFARAVGSTTVEAGAARVLLGGGKAHAAFRSAPDAVRDKAWEYATDFLLAPAWFPKQLVIASSRQLAALSTADRDALFAAADAARGEIWTASAKATEQGVQKLRDYGVKTRAPTVGVLIQLEELGRELLFQWSDGAGEAGAKLVEAYYAIR